MTEVFRIALNKMMGDEQECFSQAGKPLETPKTCSAEQGILITSKIYLTYRQQRNLLESLLFPLTHMLQVPLTYSVT